MTLEQQTAIMDKTYKLLTDFVGRPPRGIVAPWWETSKEGAELTLRYGIEYDHSFSHHDCQCYWLRTGDSWIPIDYSKHPSHWMEPLKAGSETGLVEIPSNWYLDDLPPMMFIKKSPNSHGWVNPRDVEELWLDHFNFFYREEEEFVFPVTIHPDVSGHPHVLFMLERWVRVFQLLSRRQTDAPADTLLHAPRIIEHINKHEGVEWMTMEQICDDFKSGSKPPKGAWLPAEPGAILNDPGPYTCLSIQACRILA